MSHVEKCPMLPADILTGEESAHYPDLFTVNQTRASSAPSLGVFYIHAEPFHLNIFSRENVMYTVSTVSTNSVDHHHDY